MKAEIDERLPILSPYGFAVGVEKEIWLLGDVSNCWPDCIPPAPLAQLAHLNPDLSNDLSHACAALM
jgi:hypothetical protein